MAASFLIALVIAGALWVAAPHASLAADVVAHMAGEPDAWARTDVPVPAQDLAKVLDAAHVRLKPDAGMVSYAQSCLFRGHHVPHLVVQTEAGPVTVMVLAHESVSKPMPFDEEGYRGVILPARATAVSRCCRAGRTWRGSPRAFSAPSTGRARSAGSFTTRRCRADRSAGASSPPAWGDPPRIAPRRFPGGRPGFGGTGGGASRAGPEASSRRWMSFRTSLNSSWSAGPRCSRFLSSSCSLAR